jgi:hypothetical protein
MYIIPQNSYIRTNPGKPNSCQTGLIGLQKLHNQPYKNHYLGFLFYLLWLSGWHFLQVTTQGIQHADGANANNGACGWSSGGGHRFPTNYPESTM